MNLSVRYCASSAAVLLLASPVCGAVAEPPSTVVEQPVATGPAEAEAAARAAVANLEGGSDADLAGALDATGRAADRH